MKRSAALALAVGAVAVGAIGIAQTPLVERFGAKKEPEPSPEPPPAPGADGPSCQMAPIETGGKIKAPDDPNAHVCLVPTDVRVTGAAASAAAEAHAAGASPRGQIDAARKASGQNLRYAPHQGQRERMKRAKRAAQAGG